MSATTWVAIPGAMLVAIAIDVVVGEPPRALHPVVGIGRYLHCAGARLPALAPVRAFAGGAVAWLFGAASFAAAAWGFQEGIGWIVAALPSTAGDVATAVALGILLKPLFAWRMLREEVGAVERALALGVDAGRACIASLASRDAAALDAVAVRETAIESLAENLNDSVVAPLFWFAVAGLPGAMLYRFANTADAMWGYRGRWEWAGKWAARADDLLSWLPARLTALALLPHPMRWRELARQAQRTPSPNGGWPMGAMALALGVRLGKPGVYLLNSGGRSAHAADADLALRRAGRALCLCVPALLALAFALRGGA